MLGSKVLQDLVTVKVLLQVLLDMLQYSITALEQDITELCGKESSVTSNTSCNPDYHNIHLSMDEELLSLHFIFSYFLLSTLLTAIGLYSKNSV